jgi:hypothetical protein
MSVETALRTLFILGMVAAAAAMYWLVYSIFRDRVAAVTAAIVYTWAPYHFLSVFVAAAIGTVYQFVWLPLLLLGCWWCVTNRPRAGIVLTALATFFSVITHAMTYAMLAPFIGLFVLISVLGTTTSWNEAGVKLGRLVIAHVLGWLASSFYIVPNLTYLPFIIASLPGLGFADIYKSSFVTFKQLVYSKWGYGPIVSNAKEGEISLQIGIAQWLGVIGSLVLGGLAVWQKNRVVTTWLISMLSLFGLAVLSMLSISTPLWKFINEYLVLDYPFRLLLICVMAGSVLIGMCVHLLSRFPIIKALAVLGFIVVAFYTNRNHVRVNMYTDYPLDLYVRAETTTNTFHEYLPITAQRQLLDKPVADLVTGDRITVVTSSLDYEGLKTEIIVPETTKVLLHQFDFPGQTVSVDGETVEHSRDDTTGQVQADIPAGRHLVEVKYRATPTVLLSWWMSGISLVIIAGIALNRQKGVIQ